MPNSIPNLFVIGAPKSGTTSLVSVLSQHKQIFVPEEKEPRYFDADVFYDYEADYPLSSLSEYLALYPEDATNTIRYWVDGSVFCMYSEKAIASILEMCPSAKFIIVLRDPVESTKSMFSQRMKYSSAQMREVSASLNDCWNHIENGDRKNGNGFPKHCRNKNLFRYDFLYSYEKHIPVLTTLIKPENLYFASHQAMRNNSQRFYNEVFDFIGLPMSDNISVDVKLNERVAYANSFRSSVVSFLTTYSFTLRRKLNISGKGLRKLRKVLLGTNNKALEIGEDTEARIRAFFKQTYLFLEKQGYKL